MASEVRSVARAISLIRSKAPLKDVSRYLKQKLGIGTREGPGEHEYQFQTRTFHGTLSFKVTSSGMTSNPLVVLQTKKDLQGYMADATRLHTRTNRFPPEWASPLEQAFGRRVFGRVSPKKQQAGRTILQALKRRLVYYNDEPIGRSRAHTTSNGRVINGGPVKNRFSKNYLDWARDPTPVRNMTPYMSKNLPFYTEEVKYNQWNSVPKDKKCALMSFIPQTCKDGGICWFIAVLNAVLFSESLRAYVAKTLPATFRNAPRHVQFALHRVAELLVWNEGTGIRISARTILKDFHAALPKWFDDNTGTWEGGQPQAFVKPLLDLLHVPHVHIAIGDDGKLHYSIFNRRTSQEVHTWSKNAKPPNLNTSHPPAVLVVHEADALYKRPRPTPLLARGITLAGAHAFVGKARYTAQSALLISDNHAVAGITCGGKRYVLNYATICPPSEFDWVRHKSFYYTNTRRCGASPTPQRNGADPGWLNGRITTLYLRDDLLKQ